MIMMMICCHLERLLSESEPASEVCSHGLEQDYQNCDDNHLRDCDNYHFVNHYVGENDGHDMNSKGKHTQRTRGGHTEG